MFLWGEGTGSPTALPTVNLCHRYTGTTPSPPPGSHYTSPSENMWNTGSTYNLSSGVAVAGESEYFQTWLEALGGSMDPKSPEPAPPLTPAFWLGMPTAYDLSSVIAGGSSVGHNNLIPLGECPLGSMAWQGRIGMCQWPVKPVLGSLPPLSWSLLPLPWGL